MTSLFDILPYLGNYQISFFILAALSLTLLIQNFLTAPLAFASKQQEPGMPLKHDHTNLSFRVIRVFGNSAENFPAFAGALLVAIVAGSPPMLVNWLAGVYFASRMAFWVIYYMGIGKTAGGPRTFAFVGGLLSNIVLAVAAIYAVLSV